MATLYTSENRIKRADHYKSLWKETATIILDNSDQALKDVDLRGKQVHLKWGMDIDGTPYSAPTGLLEVMDQIATSQEGVLVHELKCKGIASLIDNDKASERWECSAGHTVKELVEKIAAATLDPFDHCQAYGLVVHQTSETYETLKPGTGFVIGLNDSRLEVLRYLLDHTDLFLRIERDDQLHLYQDSELCYEYSLDGEHTFFTKDHSTKAVIPNKVYVVSVELDDDDKPKWSGHASDAASIGKHGVVPWFERVNVSSNAEASSVASSIMANIKATEKVVDAVVPMNCFAEVYDKVKITDERENTSVEGHLGYLNRHFRPGHYRMEIGFGGWFNARKMRQFLKDRTEDADDQDGQGRIYLSQLPATFSAVLLEAGKYDPVTYEWTYSYHVFGQPIIPGKGRLYINAWNMYAQKGYAEIHVYAWTGAAWNLVWYSMGDGFHKYGENLVYTNPAINELPMQFVVYNPRQELGMDSDNDGFDDNTAIGVTGMLSFDMKGAASD